MYSGCSECSDSMSADVYLGHVGLGLPREEAQVVDLILDHKVLLLPLEVLRSRTEDTEWWVSNTLNQPSPHPRSRESSSMLAFTTGSVIHFTTTNCAINRFIA